MAICSTDCLPVIITEDETNSALVFLEKLASRDNQDLEKARFALYDSGYLVTRETTPLDNNEGYVPISTLDILDREGIIQLPSVQEERNVYLEDEYSLRLGLEEYCAGLVVGTLKTGQPVDLTSENTLNYPAVENFMGWLKSIIAVATAEKDSQRLEFMANNLILSDYLSPIKDRDRADLNKIYLHDFDRRRFDQKEQLKIKIQNYSSSTDSDGICQTFSKIIGKRGRLHHDSYGPILPDSSKIGTSWIDLLIASYVRNSKIQREYSFEPEDTYGEFDPTNGVISVMEERFENPSANEMDWKKALNRGALLGTSIALFVNGTINPLPLSFFAAYNIVRLNRMAKNTKKHNELLKNVTWHEFGHALGTEQAKYSSADGRMIRVARAGFTNYITR